MKVKIHLSALTRLEYTEELEVDPNISNEELDALVEQRYQEVDGGEYWDDELYWERGYCFWDKEGHEDDNQ